MRGNLRTWEEAVIWLRSQPGQRHTVQDCFYDDPISEAAQRYYHSTEWQAVRPFLPVPAGRALDLGAGRGISSYALAREGWQVTALEPDPSTIVGAGAIRMLAHESGLPVEVVETRGEALPFPAGSFDLVHARAVLHHAHDLRAFCHEAERVLKDNGLFLALREHVISRQSDLKRFQQNHPLHNLYGGEYAFKLTEYLKSMEQAGLVVEKVLNPFESDINLFPRGREELKRILGLKVIPPVLVPDRLLHILGVLYRKPGRLYSFVARKAEYE